MEEGEGAGQEKLSKQEDKRLQKKRNWQRCLMSLEERLKTERRSFAGNSMPCARQKKEKQPELRSNPSRFSGYVVPQSPDVLRQDDRCQYR